MLKTINLKKCFGGIKAVDGCNFKIKDKKITALIGPNGSGKTTIFNLVSGLIKPDSGKILFDKKDITNLLPEKISNLGISRLFQQTKLFDNLTVKENLLLALDSEDCFFWKNLMGLNIITKEKNDKAKEMLNSINMEKLENKTARDLSYGQKRLIELARCILNPHKFLMLDEPVAGVNPVLKAKIAKILLNFKKQGETILFIEHDINFTLKIADEVIVMNEGRVIAKGKPEQIKNDKRVLECYLGK